MKYTNSKISSIFLVLLIATLVSCDSFGGEPDLPIPLDETLENTGAFLRVVSVESSGFDVADLSTAQYSFVGELSDNEQGQTITEVRFFASYIPSDDDAEPVTEPADPIVSVDASSLDISDESGLPRGEFSITLQEILDALDLEVDDLNLGDVFNVRWEVETEDGRVFSADEASPAVGGGFYNSPYNANAGVVQGVPQDAFTGSYTVTQNGSGGTPFFGSIFGSTFTIDLQVDPSNGLNGRTADVTYLPGLGGFPRTLNLTFFRRQDFQSFTAADNWVSVPPPSLDLALGCSAIGLRFGAITSAMQSNFNVDDDSQFTFALVDNDDADCGGSAVPVSFTAVKN